MPGNADIFYWDAAVFLSYINGEAERLPVIDSLLDSSRHGDLDIITSSLSIVEVAFTEMEKQGHELDPDAERAIDALFHDREAVTIVEFHQLIAREARRLMRRALTDGRSLKPPDAIHLATAIQQKVTAVHTYDERVHGYGDITGLDIEFPAIPTPRLPL